MDEVDIFLAHFGVKGMKWGVRKERKPISAEVQGRREQRAQKFQMRADIASTRISELTKANETAGRFARASNNSQIDDLKKERDRNLKDASLKREGKLSTRQKKLAIAGSITAGVIVTAAAVKAVDSGDFSRSIIKGKEFLTGNKHNFKRNEFLANKDFDVDDIQSAVVKHVNPDYGKFGASMNCRRSTFAYEMRRRGYDVSATKTAFGTGQAPSGLFNATSPGDKYVSRNLIGTMTRYFKDKSTGGKFADLVDQGGSGKVKVEGIAAAFGTKSNADSIFNSLSKMPNGARGELGVMWAGIPAGHSIAWEVVKGKPVLIDAQMNKIIGSADDFAKAYTNISQAGITRLDNLELNSDFLLRWVKDA